MHINDLSAYIGQVKNVRYHDVSKTKHSKASGLIRDIFGELHLDRHIKVLGYRHHDWREEDPVDVVEEESSQQDDANFERR